MFASPAILPCLEASGLFTDADLYQARFAASLSPGGRADLAAGLTALLSLAVREGHVCLHLGDPVVRERLAGLGLDATGGLTATVVIGPAGSAMPMILDGRACIFPASFRDEKSLARPSCAAQARPDSAAGTGGRDFRDGEEVDWQTWPSSLPCAAASASSPAGRARANTTVARILTLRPACTPAKIFPSAWPRPRARPPRA
jgi:exodeoxyribonuclease V alpha subunit